MQKKRVLLFVIFLLVIAVMAGVFLFLKGKRTFSSEISYGTLLGGYSSKGVMLQDNKAPYLHFLDFKSSTEIAFGISPESSYDDPSSFASSLNSDGAKLITIYNKKLYYIRSDYVYDRKDPYTIIVYEASLDGGRVEKLGEFSGFSFCKEYIMAEGKMFLSLVKYNKENENINNNEEYITVAVGCIDLSTKKAWTLPEKSGYGAYLLFICLIISLYIRQSLWKQPWIRIMKNL